MLAELEGTPNFHRKGYVMWAPVRALRGGPRVRESREGASTDPLPPPRVAPDEPPGYVIWAPRRARGPRVDPTFVKLTRRPLRTPPPPKCSSPEEPPVFSGQKGIWGDCLTSSPTIGRTGGEGRESSPFFTPRFVTVDARPGVRQERGLFQHDWQLQVHVSRGLHG